MARGRNGRGRTPTDGGSNNGRSDRNGFRNGNQGDHQGGRRLNVAFLFDGTDLEAPLAPLDDGNFLLRDNTRAANGSGQRLNVVASTEAVLREYQVDVDRVRTFNDGSPQERVARVAHFHLFRSEVIGFIVRWGGAALPDDIRHALHTFERVCVGRLTRFDNSVRNGLVRVSRVNHNTQEYDLIFRFGKVNGGNGGNHPGANGGNHPGAAAA